MNSESILKMAIYGASVTMILNIDNMSEYDDTVAA
jgi:hypothetical protein